MSEVKRFQICGGDWEGKPHEKGEWVLALDFDRVTAERDAALGREDMLREEVERQNDIAHAEKVECSKLQQRLTAADERADVLETALKKISVRCVAYIEAEREMPEPSVEVCQMIASAALKPAEGRGDA
jgi:hypothetical protein